MAPQTLLNVVNAPIQYYNPEMVENKTLFGYEGDVRNEYRDDVKMRVETHNSRVAALELE
ncbi:UNVERIFIED_CONTAM: hypothetical protein HDU68_002460, partial [Siphonaria sp. JEL0065]